MGESAGHASKVALTGGYHNAYHIDVTSTGSGDMLKEIERRVVSGFVALAVLVVASGAVLLLFATGVNAANGGRTALAAIAAVVVLIAWGGLFSVQPNQAKALTLFGAYTRIHQDRRDCGGPIRSTPSGAFRCGCGTSRPPSSR